MQILSDEEEGVILTDASPDIVEQEWNRIIQEEENPDIDNHLSPSLIKMGYFAKRTFLEEIHSTDLSEA